MSRIRAALLVVLPMVALAVEFFGARRWWP